MFALLTQQDASNDESQAVELQAKANSRTSFNEKKRGHRVTGQSKGRPKNEYGKSKKTNELILADLHREFEEYMSKKLGSMGEQCERCVLLFSFKEYVHSTIFSYFEIVISKRISFQLPIQFFFVASNSFDRSFEHRLWLDSLVPDPSELAPLDECSFWGSPTRKRYHAITGPRVSALNANDANIYDYDDHSDIGSDINNSEDDYIDYQSGLPWYYLEFLENRDIVELLWCFSLKTVEFGAFIVIFGFSDIEIGQEVIVCTQLGPVVILVAIFPKKPWFLALF